MLRAVRPCNQLARFPGCYRQPGVHPVGTLIVPGSAWHQGLRGEKGGVAVPTSGTPDLLLSTLSSLRSFTLGYCAHHQPPTWRA